MEHVDGFGDLNGNGADENALRAEAKEVVRYLFILGCDLSMPV